MNRVALDLGFIQIYWYSIFIFLGILIGSLIAYREIKKQNINVDFFINLIFYGIIFGLIGARLYYVAFNLDYYLNHPLEILEIWNGGLAIHGAILAGTIWFIIYTKKYKQNTLKILDITSLGLIVGQAIGRWGNFFNQEAFGNAVTRQALENQGLPDFIINQMNINGIYRQPTFLYESLWDIMGFIALLIIKRYHYLKTGQILGVYFMWYSLGRFFIEGLRTDSLMIGPFRIAQIISVLLFLTGLFLVIIRGRGEIFKGLYHEKENNNDKF